MIIKQDSASLFFPKIEPIQKDSGYSLLRRVVASCKVLSPAFYQINPAAVAAVILTAVSWSS